jgi:hypothetical protein
LTPKSSSTVSSKRAFFSRESRLSCPRSEACGGSSSRFSGGSSYSPVTPKSSLPWAAWRLRLPGGYRSAMAMGILERHGLTNATHMVGGIAAWGASRLATVS